jgi:hypothetical protein
MYMKSLKHYSLVLLVPLLLSNASCFAMTGDDPIDNESGNSQVIPGLIWYIAGVVSVGLVAYFIPESVPVEPQSIEELRDMKLIEVQKFMQKQYAIYEKNLRQIELEENKHRSDYDSGTSAVLEVEQFEVGKIELRKKLAHEMAEGNKTIRDFVARGAQFPPEPIVEQKK